MGETKYPVFGAERNIITGRWKGWVQFQRIGHISYTPDTFATKAEALKAIKERV